MKLSFWDILTILFTSATVIALVLILVISTNPDSSLNPFPLPTLPPTLVLPSATPTLKSLPGTWTPTTAIQATPFLTRTSLPTETPFVLP